MFLKRRLYYEKAKHNKCCNFFIRENKAEKVFATATDIEKTVPKLLCPQKVCLTFLGALPYTTVFSFSLGVSEQHGAAVTEQRTHTAEKGL